MPEIPAGAPFEDPLISMQFPIVYEGSLSIGANAQPTDDSAQPSRAERSADYTTRARNRRDLGYSTRKLLGRNSLRPRTGWAERRYNESETTIQPTEALPERNEHEPALDYLGRCIAFTAPEKDAISSTIEEVRTELTMLYFDDPKTIHDINMHAKDATWCFLAEASQPVPECLAESGGLITTAYAPATDYYNAFASKLHPHTTRVRALIRDNEKALLPIIKGVIEGTNAYQILHSFGATAKTRTERPLTYTERTIRKSIIGREIIRDFGIQPHQLGKRAEHGPAFAAYKKRLFSLDNETAPDSKNAESSSDESFETLRTWALGHAKAYDALGANNSTITTYGERTNVTLGFTNYLAEQLDGTPYNSVLGGLLNTVITHAFSAKNELTYQEALQEAVAKTQQAVSNFLKLDYAKDVGLSSRNNTLLMWIRQTDCSNLQRDYYNKAARHNIASQQDGMHSRKAAEQARLKQVGNILYDARTPQEREFPRIIFEQAAGQPLVAEETQELALSLAWGSDESPRDVQKHTVYIPGFVVANARQQGNQVIFDFVRDPNGDPYMPTKDQLTPDQQLMIQRHYYNLGITTIAGQLATEMPQTLHETARIIRQNSIYYFPQESTTFTYTIKNARMFAQCQGGAEVGRQALTSANIMSRVINGPALPQEDAAITAVGHSQVLTIQNGTRRIIDFTPDVATQAHETTVPLPKNTPAQPPKPLTELPNEEHDKQATVEHDPQQEAIRQYKHNQSAFWRTHQAFEQTLRGYLKLPASTPSDYMYERFVATTHTTDVWWRATSALHIANSTLQTPDAALDLVKLQATITELQSIAADVQKISDLPKEQRVPFAGIHDRASLNALIRTTTQAGAQLTRALQSLRTIHQN